ncbi:MAG: hypothetical protein LUB59_00765 [Candidatus Gastranaerophilales bacterium]|nr:hypothetical protein [Candidatus Gastranaerophilales bacterium]
MFQVYTQEGNKELTKSIVGEFSDYDKAMDCAEKSIKGKPNLKYIVEETNGCFNSYGDLVSEVIAESC